jgi:hypothetical protein
MLTFEDNALRTRPPNSTGNRMLGFMGFILLIIVLRPLSIGQRS